jgi:tRNA-Thr(GGU) m(6)t(6)A37 methyltransferase TsaA
MMKIDNIEWSIIGHIHTPYVDSVPPQPETDSPEDFFISIGEEYLAGIEELDRFTYVYILFLFHRSISSTGSLEVHLPWLHGESIGVFASRSPQRPNPIGLSVAKVLEIEENRIFIDAIDVFDGTPVLDIKPYMHSLDAKNDANNGWMTKEVMKRIKAYSP